MIPKIKKYVEDHGLVFMVLGSLIVAAILVLVGLSLYKTSGAYKLDLSRPGFEKVREDVVVKDEDTPYQASGPLDQAAIEDFRARYKTQREEIESLGNFGPDALSDETLGLE